MEGVSNLAAEALGESMSNRKSDVVSNIHLQTILRLSTKFGKPSRSGK